MGNDKSFTWFGRLLVGGYGVIYGAAIDVKHGPSDCVWMIPGTWRD
jgi:hypothetical protein